MGSLLAGNERNKKGAGIAARALIFAL